jgi:O-succinylbenzoic acid--CoA ligase
MAKGFTQPDWLAHAARENPDTVALFQDDLAWDFSSLNHQVNLLVSQLSVMGVRGGLRVGILLPNSWEYVAVIWAVWRLGATTVPLNTRLAAEEIQYQVSSAECTFVITSAASQSKMPASPGLSVITLEALEANAQNYGGSLTEQTVVPEMTFTRQAIAAIVFTSGTSGRPKGAQLTFNNLYYAAMASTLRLGNDADDRWLLTLPLYHIGGLSMVVRACLCRVPIIILERFDPKELIEAMARYRATLISLVPTMLHRLLQATSENPFPASVRLVLVGGAALSPGLLAVAQHLEIPIAPTYGLTEAGSQVCTALPDEARRKPGSVGKPLPFMRVRVVNNEGVSLPACETGEIVVQGPNIMFGYVGETPPQIPLTQWGTPAYLPYQNGYMTGDLGYLDEDGDLFLVQRRSDLIVSGGENIYPAEVERVLSAHPRVKAVVVVGVDDAEWGQKVAAALVVDGDLAIAELENFARGQLAGYKLPRLWRTLSALPLNATGKIDRNSLRQLFIEQ